MTTYLRKLIPGRVEHAGRMKDAVQTTPEWRIKAGTNKDGTPKRTMTKRITGFSWGPEQEEAFSAIKQAIIHNACWGGDPRFQFHLATDASKFAYGVVLFQIPTRPVGTRICDKLKSEMRIVQFISKKLTPEETRYHTTDREALAVVRCLEECRWLVMQAASIPVILYTDHKALLSILQGESSSTRIAGWQLRLGEYNLDIVHVKGTENGLADGLSRIPVRALDIGTIGKEQSYLSAMVVVRDDIGGCTLRERGKGESTKGKKRIESTVCGLSESGEKSGVRGKSGVGEKSGVRAKRWV